MSDAVKLAKYYFNLSNQRNLSEIESLLTPSSTYSSVNTGVFLGVDQIVEMQKQFFDSFDTMGWDIQRVEEVRPGVVLFEFTFSGVTHDGEEVHRPGLEYVIVHNQKIQHVEVRNKP